MAPPRPPSAAAQGKSPASKKPAAVAAAVAAATGQVVALDEVAFMGTLPAGFSPGQQRLNRLEEGVELLAAVQAARAAGRSQKKGKNKRLERQGTGSHRART